MSKANRKILIIGDCPVDIVFDGDQPREMRPGGRLANAAIMLSRRGLPVLYAGEASTDHVGQRVIDWFNQAGVSTIYIDRVPEGITPCQLIFGNELVRYEQNPPEGFDIIWPRVEPGDIVVFGGYYALDPLRRPRLLQLLQHCHERHCIMVYLPGYLPQRAPSVTRIMPALLENLEMATIVLTRTPDIENLWGMADDTACHARHIDFYAPVYLNIGANHVSCFAQRQHWSVDRPACVDDMLWNAGFLAGMVAQLYADGSEDPEAYYDLTAAQGQALLQAGLAQA